MLNVVKRRFLFLACLWLWSPVSGTVHVVDTRATARQYTLLRTHSGTCSLVSVRQIRDRLLSAPQDVHMDFKKLNPKLNDYLVPGQTALDYVEELRISGLRSDLTWNKVLDECQGSVSYDSFVTMEEGPREFKTGKLSGEQMVFGPGGPLPVPAPAPPPLEVTPLLISGNENNRVNLVFFSDGYTEKEKGKFLADADRLATDIAVNQTFAKVNPLLNFWAAFSPSNESGIGVGGKPKDTVFGLYRDGTELRGVYTSKRVTGVVACLSLRRQCSYPILLGNDPYYGGLGGYFTITTSSIHSGASVLRHELGHSIINIGEEYDGGYVYSGVNAEPSIEQELKWSHWLSLPDEPLRAERSVMPLQGYPWTLLNRSEPYSINFTSPGTYSKYQVRFSLSGLPNKEDLKVTLDGEDLGWVPITGLGVDRGHYKVYKNSPLDGGEHNLQFTLRESGKEGVAQLCSYEILEYGNETEFNSTFGHVSAYPTYSIENQTTYRPTNDQCLMRDQAEQPNFCKPCTEGLWLSLMRRVNLADEFSAGPCEKPNDKIDDYWRFFNVSLLPLAEYRTSPVDTTESYSLKWRNYEEDQDLPQFDNSTAFVIRDADVGQIFTVTIRFNTSEVRRDPDELLLAEWYILSFGKCKDVLEPKIVVTNVDRIREAGFHINGFGQMVMDDAAAR